MHDFLLVHQTDGCIRQGEEAVIVLVHPETVAGKGVDEQLQLVVCPLGDVYAHSAKGILYVVRTFLHVHIRCHGHYYIIMCIDELLVLSRYHILHSLDVLHGNQVAWIGHRGVAVLLFV